MGKFEFNFVGIRETGATRGACVRSSLFVFDVRVLGRAALVLLCDCITTAEFELGNGNEFDDDDDEDDVGQRAVAV